jgi:hypothetical protein
MDHHFEAAGDMESWPPNERGKPTQAAVFGAYHLTRGRVREILWTGKFPDLEPAMYWAAKKEVQAVRKDKWVVASRVLWQHELTPEQAVEVAYQQMQPQLDHALRAMRDHNDDATLDIGTGPMRAVKPDDGEGLYIEATPPGQEDTDNSLAWWVTENGVSGPALPGVPESFVPRDPRDKHDPSDKHESPGE